MSPTLPQHLLVRIALLSALFTDNGLSIPLETHASLKRCLAADPDSKTCAKPLKNLKKLEKELAQLRNWVDAGRWTEAAVTIAGGASREGLLPSVKSLLETYQEPIARGAPADEAPLPRAAGDAHLAHKSPLLQHLTSTLCRAYVSLDSRKAASACREALAFDPEDTWGLVGRGDELLKREEYDEAVRVLSAAFEATGRSDRKVLERLQKAQRLLKQSKSKVRWGAFASLVPGPVAAGRSLPLICVTGLLTLCFARSCRTTTRSSASPATQTTRRSSGPSASSLLASFLARSLSHVAG